MPTATQELEQPKVQFEHKDDLEQKLPTQIARHLTEATGQSTRPQVVIPGAGHSVISPDLQQHANFVSGQQVAGYTPVAETPSSYRSDFLPEAAKGYLKGERHDGKSKEFKKVLVEARSKVGQVLPGHESEAQTKSQVKSKGVIVKLVDWFHTPLRKKPQQTSNLQKAA